MEEAQQKNPHTKVIAAFAAGLVVGGAITSLVMPTNTDVDSDRQTDEVVEVEGNTEGNTNILDITSAPPTQTNTVTEGDGVIIVENQVEGDGVRVSEVTLLESGWVVVHENTGGVIGNALGALRLDAGTYPDVFVKLLRNTEAGNVYHVVIYSDDGDKQFNIKLDQPVVSNNGAFVQATFEAIRINRKNEG